MTLVSDSSVEGSHFPWFGDHLETFTNGAIAGIRHVPRVNCVTTAGSDSRLMSDNVGAQWEVVQRIIVDCRGVTGPDTTWIGVLPTILGNVLGYSRRLAKYKQTFVAPTLLWSPRIRGKSDKNVSSENFSL